MRILHVVPTYLPATRYGGPIFAVHGLAKALATLGHDVEVFTTNADGDGESEVPIGRPVCMDGVSVTYFETRFRRLYWSPDMKRALRSRAAEFDVIHSHSVFLRPTTAAAGAARKHGVPHVISPRGMLVKELIAGKSSLVKRAWIGLFERRNLAEAAAVHFTSSLERDDAARAGLRIPRPIVIPNGIDLPPLANIARHPRRIAYLGRISWKKQIDVLIRAAALLPDIELVIAGNDDENLTPALMRLADDLRISARIRWTGPLQNAAKFELLASAAAFCLPSLSENFGNVVLEALAQETPAVLTRGVGVADELAHAGAALIAEATPESIASALARLLENPGDARAMGQQGRTVVESRFTWPAVAKETAVAYEAIATRSGGRS